MEKKQTVYSQLILLGVLILTFVLSCSNPFTRPEQLRDISVSLDLSSILVTPSDPRSIPQIPLNLPSSVTLTVKLLEIRNTTESPIQTNSQTLSLDTSLSVIELNFFQVSTTLQYIIEGTLSDNNGVVFFNGRTIAFQPTSNQVQLDLNRREVLEDGLIAYFFSNPRDLADITSLPVDSTEFSNRLTISRSSDLQELILTESTELLDSGVYFLDRFGRERSSLLVLETPLMADSNSVTLYHKIEFDLDHPYTNTNQGRTYSFWFAQGPGYSPEDQNNIILQSKSTDWIFGIDFEHFIFGALEQENQEEARFAYFSERSDEEMQELWHHVVLHFTGSELYVWVNGTKRAWFSEETNDNGNLSLSAIPFDLDQNQRTLYFGTPDLEAELIVLDDLRIYNRKLSETEIQGLSNHRPSSLPQFDDIEPLEPSSSGTLFSSQSQWTFIVSATNMEPGTFYNLQIGSNLENMIELRTLSLPMQDENESKYELRFSVWNSSFNPFIGSMDVSFEFDVNKNYLWRIVALNGKGRTIGPSWSFTTVN